MAGAATIAARAPEHDSEEDDAWERLRLEPSKYFED
jgi:hypothetical protein